MTRAADPARAEAFQRVLGDEVRRAREQHHWTRLDLLTRMKLDLSIQALATYEQGTRPLTVVRLVELANGLGVSPLDLLARALNRVSYMEPGPDAITVHLVATVDDPTPELAPLRRWAQRRLADGQASVVRLDSAALRSLALVCGVDTDVLADRLRALTVSACDG